MSSSHTSALWQRFYQRTRASIFAFSQAMNFRPTWQQAQVMQDAEDATYGKAPRRIAVKSGQGPGKCMTKCQEVFDALRGRRVTVGELAEEQAQYARHLEVFSKDAQGRLAPHEAVAFPSGEKECVRVSTKAGTWIEVSTDHPVFTPQGWVHAADLVPGQLVAMPRRLNVPRNRQREISDDLVKFAAYMASDGCTASNKVFFTNMSEEILSEFEMSVQGLGGGGTRVKASSRAWDVNVRGLRDVIFKLGYEDCLSKNKRVPADFYGLSDRQIALFLNRFYACDGYVEKDGLGITLASEGMIRDLQTLLLRLGIFSSYAYRVARCNGKEFDAWRLSVRGQDAIEFLRVVGPILSKEAACEKLSKYFEGRGRNTNTDIVPLKTEEMAEIVKELGIASRRGKRKSQQTIDESVANGATMADVRALCRGRSYAYVSRQKFARFCEITGYDGKHAWLATSDLRWVPVTELVPIGKHPVYDLSVPDTGNFVAQNVVIHNTTCSGIIGAWRAWRSDGTFTVVTAPTMRQCHDVWLGEFRRNLSNAHPLLQRYIECTETRVVMFGQKSWGVKFATATRPENLQGLHHKDMTVIFEEASGIARAISETMQGTQTNNNFLWLQIGNPNTRDSAFFDCFNSQRSKWVCRTLNAEDTARDYPQIITPETLREHEDQYGRDSDFYRVRVLGEFPFSDPNCVMSSEELEKVALKALMVPCSRLNRLMVDGKKRPAQQIGLDFARFGADESVIAVRQGDALIQLKVFSKVEPAHVIRYAFRIQETLRWRNEDTLYLPDATGMGQGLLHLFTEAGKVYHPFHNHGRSYGRQYANKITEAFFELGRMVKDRRCYLGTDSRLQEQLCNRQYFTDTKGKFVLESKDDYMKRGHDSPDRADAVALAFYNHASGIERAG